MLQDLRRVPEECVLTKAVRAGGAEQPAECILMVAFPILGNGIAEAIVRRGPPSIMVGGPGFHDEAETTPVRDRVPILP
jgi:hypothetical protein